MISNQKVKKLISLYTNKKKSAQEISNELPISVRQVYYYLQRNNILRRSVVECNKLSFAKKSASFSMKQKLSLRERELYIFCLSMYWCEGFRSKSARGVDFANSNPKMIKIFVSFLRTICRVDEHRLRCYLYCFSNQDAQNLIRYWSDLTGIATSQFTKPYVRNEYRLDKINKMPYGLIHIRYYDKKLLYSIMNKIEDIANILV